MKTKNMMVSVLVGVLIVGLWYTMLLKPTRSKAAKVRADTAAQQAKLAPLQTQLDKARRQAAHAAQFKSQLQSLQQAMPSSPALAAFIRDGNGIAEASGVSWQSVTHGPPTLSAGGAMSIGVSIQVQGTYGQVLDYLGRLAAVRRLVVVDGVQLSTSAPTGAAGANQAVGGSTGPFTGASQLAATISARMFESPAAAAVSGSPVGSVPGTSQIAPAVSSN
jgi:Tfp pilus assembly protein PilO